MSSVLRVLLLSKYGRQGASSRLRSYQYIPYFAALGVEVEAAPLLDDRYVRGLYGGSVPMRSVLAGYFSRLSRLLKGARFDLVWLEKELFPWVPAFLELAWINRQIPYLIDYDDAIFHRYDHSRWGIARWLLADKIDRVMKAASLVVAGSDYLVDRARRAGARRVEKLATVVDLARYPVAREGRPGRITIGWIGTPNTSRYLLPLLPLLRKVSNRWDARIVAIGAASLPEFDGLVEVAPWSESSEVDAINAIDIGIMPLPDEPFERGKCGYKLIQYMACGKSVVASPVGENVRIVRHGVNGFHATHLNEWRLALDALCADAGMRARFGRAGRACVEAEYSLAVTAPRLCELLREGAAASARG